MTKKLILLFCCNIFFAMNSDKFNSNLPKAFTEPKSKWHNKAHSNLKKDNLLDISIEKGPMNQSMWITLHCENINPIAGFQFELPDNLDLLEVEGLRSKEVGFQLHKNNQGLILGFSMSGDTISNFDKDKNSSAALIKIHVKSDFSKNVNFPIKTILAGPKGQKLTFTSVAKNFKFNDSNISFLFSE